MTTRTPNHDHDVNAVLRIRALTLGQEGWGFVTWSKSKPDPPIERGEPAVRDAPTVNFTDGVAESIEQSAAKTAPLKVGSYAHSPQDEYAIFISEANRADHLGAVSRNKEPIGGLNGPRNAERSQEFDRTLANLAVDRPASHNRHDVAADCSVRSGTES